MFSVALTTVPMNLNTMGAGGLDSNTANQLAASSGQDGHQSSSGSQPAMATNAGIISSMAQL